MTAGIAFRGAARGRKAVEPSRDHCRSDAASSPAVQQPAKRKKALKEALRSHDPQAAKLLLAHSVALGHERLAVGRYLAAHYLGSDGLDPFKPYCRDAVRRFRPQALLTLARKVARELHLEVDVHDALSQIMTAGAPLILPYAGVRPRLASDPLHCGAQVSLAGRLVIGARSWFGPGAVVRGDGHFVRIGDDFLLGERSTAHIAHDLFPVLIGSRVTAGHKVVIHGCTIGDDCLLEDGAIILDGAVVEDNVIVEAGTTVYPRSTLKSGWVHSGCPARPIRQFGAEEYGRRRASVADSVFASIFDSVPGHPSGKVDGEPIFIARTTDLRGRIRIGAGSGIFFGCKLDGRDAGIEIGPDCNVQDNSLIEATNGPVTIGANVTIGHNVDMASCAVGRNSLIGMGCRLAEGTIVDDDVLLAAGSTTEPGQHLERGWLWGGRPARPMTKLDDTKRAMMSGAIEIYRVYGVRFTAAQQACLA